MKTTQTTKPAKAFAMISHIDQAIIKNAVAKLAVSKLANGKANAGKANATVETVKPMAGLFSLVAGKVMAMPKFLQSGIANHKAHGRFSGTNANPTLTQEGAIWFANREGRAWGSAESDKEYKEALAGARYTVKPHHGVTWPMKDNGMPFPVGSGFIGRMAFFRVLADACK